MLKGKFAYIFIVIITLFLSISQSFAVDVRKVSLNEALDIALKNNRHRLVSNSAFDIAEAQHKQALSAYWPQLKLEVSASRMDEDPNFIFPESPMNLGANTAPLAEAIASAQLLKQGVTPDNPLTGGLAGYNAALASVIPQVLQGLNSMKIPAQDIKLMDRDNLVSSLRLIYPLYTGGKISSVVKQAKLGVEAAKEGTRRTDLQVVHDVKQMYYSSILAMSLYKLGQDTLERFEVTLELTEKLYKTGSGRVKKTDYLRTQVVVSSIRSMLELLKSNLELSKSALVNTMGLDWQTKVEPADGDIPFTPHSPELEKIVTDAYQFNPQLAQVEIGIDASEAKIDEANAGHLPVFVLFGNVNHIENSLDSGMMTSTNKNSWVMGIRMELPIFEGFRTKNEVKEARARLEKLKQERVLLREGLALQVKDSLLQIARAQGQVKAIRDALEASRENRELNVRAYQEELVETKDVIEAQLIEFFINGQYVKALYDNEDNQINLEFIIGKKIFDENS